MCFYGSDITGSSSECDIDSDRSRISMRLEEASILRAGKQHQRLLLKHPRPVLLVSANLLEHTLARQEHVSLVFRDDS